MTSMTMYWSRSGTICCAVHTPPRGSDRHRDEGWESIPQDALADWETQTGAPPQCEECASAHARSMTAAYNAARGAPAQLVARMFPGTHR